MEVENPLLTTENAGASDELPSSANSGGISRVQYPEDKKLSPADFLELWKEQNRYIDHLESKLKVLFTKTPQTASLGWLKLP